MRCEVHLLSSLGQGNPLHPGRHHDRADPAGSEQVQRRVPVSVGREFWLRSQVDHGVVPQDEAAGTHLARGWNAREYGH